MGPRKDDEISFKEHFEEKIDLIKRIDDERWVGHKAVHDMGQRALDEAFRVLETRLEGMNQFRVQIYSERAEFLKVQVYDSEHKALETKLETATERNAARISLLENNQSNQAGRTAAYTSLVGAIFILLQIFLHFWK